MPIRLGTVGHFCIAVRDPKRATAWWVKNLNVKKEFEFPGGAVVGTDDVGIVLIKGTPRPEAIDHVSFHLKSMSALRAALKQLKRNKVDIEDPGDEIGPEAPGSKNMGLWFHDPDGYRWELSVLAKAAKRPRKRARAKRSKKK
jgi:catechol 2,3-dioxygenase-like lactoylglutathione lyase family enzyme